MSSLPALEGFDLVRMAHMPGKLLSINLQGIARGKDGSHAIAEYQLLFVRPSDVSLELTSAPVVKLAGKNPIEISSSSGTPGLKRVRMLFESGALQMEVSDSYCAELRYDRFSDFDEQRYRRL